MQSKTIPAYGTNVHFLDGGHGEPLLLIHGIGESAYSWSANSDVLAEKFHVIVPDLVGWAYTPPSREHSYSADSLGDFILAFMVALGLAQTNVVGWSLGGAATLNAVLKAPQRFTRLMLVDPAGLGVEVHPIFRAIGVPVLGELLTLPNMLTLIVNYRVLYTQRHRAVTDAFLKQALQAVRQPWHQQSVLKTVRVNRALQEGQKRVDVHERVRELTMPVQMVWGRQDKIIPAWHGERALKAMPNAQLTIYDDCGHMPFLEHADEFNALALKFFSET